MVKKKRACIFISGSGTNYTLDDYSNNNIIKKGWYVYHVDLPFGTTVVNLIEPNQIVLSNGFESTISNMAVKFLFFIRWSSNFQSM